MEYPPQLSFISNVYPRLTYIHLELLTPVNPSLHLALPDLTTLHLSMASRPVLSGDVGHWGLPNLRHLMLTGPFEASEIYALLHQVGAGVTECHITQDSIYQGRRATRISNDIWSLLPAVETLGILFPELTTLSPHSRPLRSNAPPINLLVHFTETSDRCASLSPADLAQFYQVWSPFTFGRLNIDVSWAELTKGVEDHTESREPDVSEADLTMFDVLDGMGSGNALRDRDGMNFDEEIRRRLWMAVARLGEAEAVPSRARMRSSAPIAP
jgi:hypothetical protein